MTDAPRVRMTGPLVPFKAGFAAELSRQGYARGSLRGQLRLMAHLSRWLAAEGLEALDLTPAVAERFSGSPPCRPPQSASPHTLTAYRDTMRLLLCFATSGSAKPSDLDVGDLDAPLIGAFLEHLECERDNTARTRNARLGAIRSLFRYAALRHPEHAGAIERVLAIPPKRLQRNLVTFLTEEEVAALLGSC